MMTKLFCKDGINKESYEPKYVQLKKVIRNLIVNKQLSPGDKIPSEKTLMGIYKVSSTVVIRSLHELVNENFLYRMQGKGTFVIKQREKQQNNSQSNKKFIGLIMPFDLTHDMLFSDMIIGLEEVLVSKGYHLLISNSRHNPDHERECIYNMRKIGAQGLVFFLTEEAKEQEVIKNNILSMKEEHFPFVLVDRYLKNIETDYVTTDNFLGAYEATEHLIKSGCKRIIHITCSDWMRHTATIDRLKGYEKAMIDYNLATNQNLKNLTQRVRRVNQNYETVLRTLLKKGHLPAGVFCSEAHVTTNLALAIQKIGLRMPEDIAVVGFDVLEKNLPVNISKITAVIQPMKEIGKKTAQLLIEKISLGTHEIKQFKLKPDLVTLPSEGSPSFQFQGSPGERRLSLSPPCSLPLSR